MSTSWSIWVMFLVVLNLGITLFLFIWGSRVPIPVQEDGTSGHVWAHGTVREGVRPLPRWWIVLSILTFIAAFGYLILFPGFGNNPGLLDWSSRERLEQHLAENAERRAPLAERAAGMSLTALADDTGAVRAGHRVFQDNCAACHGKDGTGSTLVGAPDLTDDVWLWGETDEALLTTLHQGRQGAMPDWSALGAETTKNLAYYVMSLSGLPHDPIAARAGAEQWGTCAACHGQDGTGNQALGAPDLTNNVWAWGGSFENILTTIRDGRQGNMPAWEERLTDLEIQTLGAWIRSRTDTENNGNGS